MVQCGQHRTGAVQGGGQNERKEKEKEGSRIVNELRLFFENDSEIISISN